MFGALERIARRRTRSRKFVDCSLFESEEDMKEKKDEKERERKHEPETKASSTLLSSIEPAMEGGRQMDKDRETQTEIRRQR